MSLDKLVTWFIEDDYDAIKRLAPEAEDPDLPDTFDEWLEFQTDVITKLESQGIAFKKIIIDSEGLAAFCYASGIDHDRVGRQAYTVYVNRRGRYPGAKDF